MTEVVRDGRAHAWGTSEWSAQQITEAFWIARTHGLEPPQFEQPQYNMFHRARFEQEYHPLYQAPYRIGTTTWSPLMSGVLTGKYNDGIPEGSRLTQPGYEWLQGLLDKHRAEGTIDKVRELTQIARDELDCSMTELALAWVLSNPNVTTVLLGATKVSQLEENLRAVDVARRLTPELSERIEAVLGNKPDTYQGWGGAGLRSLSTI
jgi:aryl-alcohol dehydrogenase-like predicted oxidoreductase